MLWLFVCYEAVRIIYPLGKELDQCAVRQGARPIAIEGTWPSLRHTCIYERADGSMFRESDYARQVATIAVGALAGLTGAAGLLWLGIRRTPGDSRG